MTNHSWIGQTLNNRYRIESLLGQGGMSSVYKGSDPNLRRPVAIKMIHPHLSNDPEFMRRFEEEAAIVAQLRHENIVNVFDFNHDDGVYYMILEYLPGETLEDRLKHLNEQKRQMDPVEAITFITQICDAIGYAHRKGMIHRDIKPDNIMLDIYGRAILMDFGISRMVGGQMHTAAGAVIGTAMYMSPEQIRGEVVDERTDLYSLGVTLFETLSGKPPFEADTAMTLMMKHLNDPVPDIRQLQPGVPASLVRLITKAMAKDRQDRYKTAAEMSADLRTVFTRITGENLKPVVKGETHAAETQVEIPPVERTQVEAPAPVQNTRAEIPPVSEGTPASVHSVIPNTAASLTPASLPPDTLPPARSPRRLFLAGGVAALAVIGIAAGLFFGMPGLREKATIEPTIVESSVGNLTGILPAGTATPAAVDTPAQSTAPVQAASAPTATFQAPVPAATSIPADRPYIQITNITIQSDRYVVEYKVFHYTEDLSGTHEHFFFNTVPPDQAGMPSKAQWVLFGGPGPFRGFTIFNRPAGASQMCALVANANHTVQPDSGNCYDLPNP
jgi:serine/threonine protein kinase